MQCATYLLYYNSQLKRRYIIYIIYLVCSFVSYSNGIIIDLFRSIIDVIANCSIPQRSTFVRQYSTIRSLVRRRQLELIDEMLIA